uniref:Uncharacterized protein n=1 Tax=Globodera rostochiensis TaxID=31243 RepID=A0A914ID26_GLORO
MRIPHLENLLVNNVSDICGRTFADGYLRTDICGRTFADGYLRTDICGRTASHSAGGEGAAGGPLPPAEWLATPLEGRGRLADPCPQQNGQPLRWREGGGWWTPAPSRTASHSAGGEGAAGGPLPPAEWLAIPLERREPPAAPSPPAEWLAVLLEGRGQQAKESQQKHRPTNQQKTSAGKLFFTHQQKNFTDNLKIPAA